MRRAAATADSPDAGEPHAIAVHLQGWCRACLHLAALAFLACAFVQTAGRARHDPWDLAFVVAAYASLAALFVVLRRAERLTPESPADDRRVARIMPAAMAVAVWAMTATVVAGGLYFLVLNDGDRGSEEDCHVADDGKLVFQKIPREEMV
ncbi:hypothetical protein OsJ_17358 [Oryza sativa Japonica Group]|uniref:Uncharacterized protein n=1 Tax=Oryza sativa subsp. japonica TaxID=39947 RepID=B9FMT9_ORYSJ|nr:hypothetical protein OsJ_17358 [Oryza sativa Japonica Group]